MWMLHGDVGEDNTTPLVMSKEDSTPGEWIESGPHLMLIPKDASEVASFTDDFMHGELAMHEVICKTCNFRSVFRNQHQVWS